ncbi:putative ribonuclease H-like domain-containing protein [Tanacetum coccineum]|uniref:Ribonuclease H-like domain-containing protein n=1 Tax=Tanacetum coccineum TaxID=301880 RepID=A0ABQ5IHC7_9ASTR
MLLLLAIAAVSVNRNEARLVRPQARLVLLETKQGQSTARIAGKRSRKPALSFMRPFWCPVEYSTNSKAIRVFNSRTRIIEENLHVKFSDDTPNIVGKRPKWLFDIDVLTMSMNYKLIVAGNQSNGSVGTKSCGNVGKARVETIPRKDYILLALWTQDPSFSSSSKDSPDAGFKPSGEEEKKDAEDPGNEDSVGPSTEEPRVNQENDASVNSTNIINTVSSPFNTAGIENNDVDENIVYGSVDDLNMPELEENGIFSDVVDDNSRADMNNLDTYFQVSPIPTTRTHKDHPLEQVIRDLHSAPQTRRMTMNLEEHGLFSLVHQRTNHKDFQNCLFACFLSQEEPKKMDVNSAFLYGKIEEEVYVCQPPRFEDPDFPDRVYKVEKALYGLHQAPRAWYETLSTYLLDNGFQRGKIDKTLFIKRDKSDILLVQVYVDDIIFRSTRKKMCTEFEKMMHKKFQMSSMGELTFFLGLQVKQKEDGIFISQDNYVNEILNKFGFGEVKTAKTPMETQKALLKDADGKDVDEHLYRSMIGSLMYLTSSRHDIMFAVCACASFQVNPKVSHLNAVKRIFRYLKGASLNRKSTIGGCQFLGFRLISWQCKKQTVVANSTTEAEYIAASNCCGQGKLIVHIFNHLHVPLEGKYSGVAAYYYKKGKKIHDLQLIIMVAYKLRSGFHTKTLPKPNIPYPSRFNDQKLREKATNQMEMFFQIFQDMHFDISFADALLLMPKFSCMIKSLLTNKDKLFELAKIPMNKNCSAMLLKNLPEKLRDPNKFLIPLGKFYFPTDFVVVDFKADRWVPLILGSSFLRTERVLIDVYEEEITLWVNDKAVTFNLNQTTRYSSTYDDMLVNRIDVIDVACEEYAQEVLGFSNNLLGRNPTMTYEPIISNSSLSFTLFKGSDFILEEIEAYLKEDSISLEIDHADCDLEGDICLIENFINNDPFQLPLMDLKKEEVTKAKSSIKEPPELELKDLPSHLEYDYLEGTNKLPVIIAKKFKR